MSGFDVQMQSDALVQRDRQFYDGARYQMQDNMMGGLRQSVSQIHQGLELGQQLSIRKAEADLRNQVAQQEIQFNEFKLRSMAQLDALDMSKHQVEAARLANESAAFQLEQMRKRSQVETPSAMRQQQTAQILKAFDSDGGAAAKGFFPSDDGERVEWVDPNSPEYDKRMTGIREARRSRRSAGQTDSALDYLNAYIRARSAFSPEAAEAAALGYKEITGRDISTALRGVGGTGGQQPQPVPTGEPAPAEQRWRIPGIWPEGKEYRDLEPQQRSAAQALQDPRWSEEGTLWSELANRGVAIKAAQAIGYLSQQWLMGADNRGIGEDMAHRYVMGSIEEGNHELYGFLLRASDVDRETVQSLLRLKFNLGDATLKKVMEAIDKEEADMRKRAAKQR